MKWQNILNLDQHISIWSIYCIGWNVYNSTADHTTISKQNLTKKIDNINDNTFQNISTGFMPESRMKISILQIKASKFHLKAR